MLLDWPPGELLSRTGYEVGAVASPSVLQGAANAVEEFFGYEPLPRSALVNLMNKGLGYAGYELRPR